MKKRHNAVKEVTFSINQEQDGCELRFPEPPGKPVTELLSKNGWHFNKGGWKDPRWYKKRTPESERFGSNFAVVLNRRAKAQDAPKQKIEADKPVNTPAPQPPQPITAGAVKPVTKSWF
jgi:hypothetical protein